MAASTPTGPGTHGRRFRPPRAASCPPPRAEVAGPRGGEGLARLLESAVEDDKELREVLGDSLGDPAAMQRKDSLTAGPGVLSSGQIEERVRRKGRDILQPKSGSALPIEVVFNNYDPFDLYIWLELYSKPSEKDVEILGTVLRSWYLMGKLGAYNTMNLQLTNLPVNAAPTYSQRRAEEALPAAFHNIGDLEFQDHVARLWQVVPSADLPLTKLQTVVNHVAVDLGTSDPLALDVLINSLTSLSSDMIGLRRIVFGGQNFDGWEEGMTNDLDGYILGLLRPLALALVLTNFMGAVGAAAAITACASACTSWDRDERWLQLAQQCLDFSLATLSPRFQRVGHQRVKVGLPRAGDDE
eukprot:SM000099S25226  [mRNA]  locus=s99:326017:328744:+ [translate_table: standard]